MSLSNFCIISSGFQLLNAHEYSRLYSLDTDYIAIFGSEHEKNQIISTANFLNCKKMFFVKNQKIVTYFHLLKFLFKKIDNFIIGHLEDNRMLFLSKTLSYNKIILIDDGISSIKNHKDYFSKNYNNIRYPKELHFFSIFNLERNKFTLKNSFEFISDSEKRISNDVFFIGQPMESVLGEKKYYRILENIKLINPNITYIAHRRDSDIKLAFISEKLEFKVLRLTDIVELYLIKSSFIPKKIISFYSTSLITLKLLFKEKITVNFVFESDLLSGDLLNVFKDYNIKSEI
jgi:TM2 domain-containing membrane protein YozV